jgi:hypothetical protein
MATIVDMGPIPAEHIIWIDAIIVTIVAVFVIYILVKNCGKDMQSNNKKRQEMR